jgi:hypothetical protein
MNFDDLFLNHRTCYAFSDKPVSNDLLKEIYDVSKYGSTSFNTSPMRVIFITSEEQKQKLLESMMPGNVEKTRSAPVTAIFAYDVLFYNKLDKLCPPIPNASGFFINNDALIEETAFRNSSLQAAYFMMVARSKGLDCGPMSGFNTDLINRNFLQESGYKVNFLCNLGYKSNEKQYPTLPRLEFDEACKII